MIFFHALALLLGLIVQGITAGAPQDGGELPLHVLLLCFRQFLGVDFDGVKLLHPQTHSFQAPFRGDDGGGAPEAL